MTSWAEDGVRSRYEAAGWRMLRRGAPDFLAIRESDDGKIVAVKAIEVKNEGEALSPEQEEYRRALKSAGMDFVVERPPSGPPRTMPAELKDRTAVLRRQNRIVVPKPVMETLGAEPGDLLLFEKRAGGRIYVSVADVVTRGRR